MSTKNLVLSSLLAISLLLNVAGLVFFIGFLNVNNKYRAVKRQHHTLEGTLNILRATALMPGGSTSDLYRRSFVSQADGRPDNFALIPPTCTAPYTDLTLVVYLHGMGSSYMEPFQMPPGEPLADAITTRDSHIIFLSLSYRGESSWGSNLSMSDISQNIREAAAQFPIKRIIVMGTSMGGCTALTYCEQAPADIKDKITGVVSVESAGDLTELYRTSHHPTIQPALIAALGGTPEQVSGEYKSRSFLYNLDKLPRGLHVVVVSARGDEIVPPQLQKDVTTALEKLGQPAKLIEIDGGHRSPAASVYLEALRGAESG